MSTVGPHELHRNLPPVDFVTEDRKLTGHKRARYGYDEGYLRRAAKWLIERMFSKTDQGRHDESLALKEAARLKAVWLEAEGMCEANCWYDLALRRYREQAREHRLRSYRPSLHHVFAQRTGTHCRARRSTRRASSSSQAREGPTSGDSEPPGPAWGRINTELSSPLQGLAGTSCGARDVTSDLGVLS